MVLFWHPRLGKFLGKERARMKNRSLYSVLTRFGIIGAVLATLVLIAPAASAADAVIEYAENGTDPVATLVRPTRTATPSRGRWDARGRRRAISRSARDGVLTSSPASRLRQSWATWALGQRVQGDGDGQRRGIRVDVEVTVTDVDEPGTVSLASRSRRLERPMTATGA